MTSLTLCAMSAPDAAFADRVRIASAAGFDSIGLTIGQYREALDDGLDVAAMREMLRATEIRVAEVEGPWDWISGDSASSQDTEMVLDAVRELGCGQVTVVQFREAGARERVAALQGLCDAVGEHGARVSVEFIPFSLLPSLADAWRLIESAGRENCGLVLDVWHLARTEGWEDLLASIPSDRLDAVQLCDAAPTPERDLREEARHRRLLPGEGSTATLRRLADLGFAGRLSTEVWSDALRAQEADVAASALFAASMSALDAAGWR